MPEGPKKQKREKEGGREGGSGASSVLIALGLKKRGRGHRVSRRAGGNRETRPGEARILMRESGLLSVIGVLVQREDASFLGKSHTSLPFGGSCFYDG